MAVYCEACGKSFTRKDSLHRHKATVHERPVSNISRFGKRKCERGLRNDLEINNKQSKRFKHEEDFDSNGVTTELDNKQTNDAALVESGDESEATVSNDNTEALNNKHRSGDALDVYNKLDTDEEHESDDTDEEDINMQKGRKILEIYQRDGDSDETSEGETESENDSTEDMSGVIEEQDKFFKHDLFEIIKTPKEIRNKLNQSKDLITVRIYPPPAPMSCTKPYYDWMNKLFNGILEYFNNQYDSSEDDYLELQIYHHDHPITRLCAFNKRNNISADRNISKFLDRKLPHHGDITIQHTIEKHNNRPICGGCNRTLC